MHTSIRNMNYSMDLRQQILEAQLKGKHVVNTTPPVIKRTPDLDPIAELESKIHNERLFIAKYKCNYRWLAEEAYGRIKYYRKRITALKEEQS